MQVSLEASSPFSITAYDEHSVTIAQCRYTKSIKVTPAGVTSDWPVSRLSELTLASLGSLDEVSVVIIGTRASSPMPLPKLGAKLSAIGIGLEVMALGAACRTFNILLAEGRQVCLALVV